jgi:hypothetical protein
MNQGFGLRALTRCGLPCLAWCSPVLMWEGSWDRLGRLPGRCGESGEAVPCCGRMEGVRIRRYCPPAQTHTTNLWAPKRKASGASSLLFVARHQSVAQAPWRSGRRVDGVVCSQVLHR